MLKILSGERYALGFCFVIEAVTDARNGQDQLWSFGDGLDFLTQLCHVHVQAMRPGMRFISPDRLQQHLSCENLATIGNEGFEQTVFGGSQ